MLVLDSGGVTRLAERSREAVALQMALRSRGLWPPRVPTVVLVECLQGHAARDAQANRLLKACHVLESVPFAIARRAASLRRLPVADPPSTRSSSPSPNPMARCVDDLHVLAQHARTVAVERV